MMDLLSKDHTILKKGMMEYRPFGADEHGQQIRDATGVKIRAFVDYLEDLMIRTHGANAGEPAVQELCRRLNERIADPTYHINAKFEERLEQLFVWICLLPDRIM